MTTPILKRTIPSDEVRPFERLLYHYQVEKELAAKLKAASRLERPAVYPAVYEELFQRVRDHPSRTRASSREARIAQVRELLKVIEPWLNEAVIYLEIGAGDAALAREVAKRVRRVYALEVSRTIIESRDLPDNLEVMIIQGIDVPVSPGSIHLAYSNQVMEHLHPEDAHDQLLNINRALKAGGKYICITPNCLTGPHDISRYFDVAASGLHLKEYTVSELKRMMQAAGFRRVSACYVIRGGPWIVPGSVGQFVEWLLAKVPARVRRDWFSGLICHCVISTK